MKKEIKRITCMCGLCGKTHDIPVLQYEDNMQVKDKEVWYLKTVYYCKIVLQYAENGLEVVLTFRDDLFSCLQRLCGCAYILGQTTAN